MAVYFISEKYITDEIECDKICVSISSTQSESQHKADAKL